MCQHTCLNLDVLNQIFIYINNLFVHICLYIRTDMHESFFENRHHQEYIQTYVYMYIFIYIQTYVYMYIYIYIYIYMYLNILKPYYIDT
jgi:hypothetical protein